MSGINKVILIGRVGKDPETRYMPNGKAVSNLVLATSEKWKDKNSGEQKELTEWHRVVCFERTAEFVGEHVSKGSLVYVEGKLQTKKWTDDKGNERYTTEIKCHSLQMLGSKGENSQTKQQPTQNNQGAQQGQGESKRPQEENQDDWDVPF